VKRGGGQCRGRAVPGRARCRQMQADSRAQAGARRAAGGEPAHKAHLAASNHSGAVPGGGYEGAAMADGAATRRWPRRCEAADSQWVGGRAPGASGRRATGTMRPAIGTRSGGNEDVGRGSGWGSARRGCVVWVDSGANNLPSEGADGALRDGLEAAAMAGDGAQTNGGLRARRRRGYGGRGQSVACALLDGLEPSRKAAILRTTAGEIARRRLNVSEWPRRTSEHGGQRRDEGHAVAAT
jgi:hypothetical protein